MEENNLIKELSLPIYQSKGWMKLLGIVLIVEGVLVAFSLVGIIIAWLPIWLGILIYKAAKYIEIAQLQGDKTQLLEALKKIKTFFIINGVLMLVALVMMAISFIISGGAIFSLMNSMH